MSLHAATINWERQGDSFADGRYHRTHVWRFDGGVEVPASSAPSVVPLPMSSSAAVDPEEAFVAALASCHMLWFLSIAQGQGHVVDRYEDAAEGVMGRDAAGRIAMTQVRLRPAVAFAGDSPDADTLAALHEEAHHRCFLAASVLTEIVCEPRPVG